MITRSGHREPIAREGLPYVFPPAVLALVLWWFGYPHIAVFLLLAAIAIALFFRNPERTPPPGAGEFILSPADGRVMEVVENVVSSHLESSRLTRVSIFMSIFDVHVNRSPISGTVKKITYTAGRFLDAREKVSSEINEQNSVVLEGEAGTIEVVQVAGKIARRITCWVRVDDEVRCGDRFGIVHFGSRLDVYLPEEFVPLVRAGIRVKAGLTPIAVAGKANG